MLDRTGLKIFLPLSESRLRGRLESNRTRSEGSLSLSDLLPLLSTHDPLVVQLGQLYV